MKGPTDRPTHILLHRQFWALWIWSNSEILEEECSEEEELISSQALSDTSSFPTGESNHLLVSNHLLLVRTQETFRNKVLNVLPPDRRVMVNSVQVRNYGCVLGNQNSADDYVFCGTVEEAQRNHG